MRDIASVPRNISRLWKIYNSVDVKKQFQCHARIDVSKLTGETELPTKMMESFIGAKEEWWFVLPNSLNGSRVILTFSEADNKKLGSPPVLNATSCGNLSAMQQESTVQSQDFSDDITGLEHSQDFIDGTEITGPEVSVKDEIVGCSSEVSDLRISVPTGEKQSQYFTDGTETTVPEVSDEEDVVGFYSEPSHLRTLVLTGDKPLILVVGVGDPNFPQPQCNCRDPNIASPIGPSIHLLPQRPLTDEEELELFLKEGQQRRKKESIFSGRAPEENLAKCGGLPLSICVVVGLLSTRKYSVASWLRVIEDPEQKQKEEEGTMVNDDIQLMEEEAAGISEHTLGVSDHLNA
ncbi:hypothetical protein Pint_21376 [Pistacia integerrima]|uniref:Uncharacterized protein n=1 Tax=Pistacia integerrima TaxID=434235 RepID=A0ACC0XAM8_9ROSI|nr:hypothetical protein Pint_21376 [Pistacia integerrima]